MNDSSRLESGDRRRFPIWAWFAAINLIVVVAAVTVIVAYLNREQHRIVNPAGQPTATLQPKHEQVSPNDIVPSNAPLDGKRDGGNGPETNSLETTARSTTAPLTTADVVAKVQEGVVLLTTYGSGGEKVGYGSGFVIDSKGLVATNFHVLRRASSADVEFHNHDKIKVKGIRAWDMAADLAILELVNLPTKTSVLEFSATTERPDAEDVIAIGHPQQFKFTTTTGILSAVRKTAELPPEYRRMLGAKSDDVWLQTNAVISGGSSGGPLLDRAGRVIGINTWVSGNYSFAIDVRHLVALQKKMKSDTQSLVDLTGPDERFARLIAEFQQKAQWFNVEWEDATSEAQRLELEASKHPASEYAPRLYDLAVEFENAPIAFDCLVWACQIAGQVSAPAKCDEPLRRAADRFAEKYPNDPRLIELMLGLRGSLRPGAWYLMQRIGEKTTDKETQGIALYCCANCRLGSGKEEDSNTAIEMFEKVIQEYPEVIYHCSDPRHPQHFIAEESKELLYQAKNLSIGRQAMSVRGKGIDGVAFKLDDYRGKVVLLDFWSDWCPPCQQMWPHERQLVEELKDAPFAMIGVYSGTRTVLQKLVDDKTITWKNWVEEEKGPIADQWRVSAFPTIYVLDHEGVIRFQARGYVPDAELSKWIQELVDKVPKTVPPTPSGQ